MNPMYDSMILKTQLRAYLKSKGISAAELARLSGVPKQSISDWLAGTSPRNIEQIKRVANVFEISLDQLLFGVEETKSSKNEPAIDIDSLLDGRWITGVFEVRLRKIKDP